MGKFRNPQIGGADLQNYCQQDYTEYPVTWLPWATHMAEWEGEEGREDATSKQEGPRVHHCHSEDYRKTNRAPTASGVNKHGLCGVPLLSN